MSHKTLKTLSVLGVATVATGVATTTHAEETQASTQQPAKRHKQKQAILKKPLTKPQKTMTRLKPMKHQLKTRLIQLKKQKSKPKQT